MFHKKMSDKYALYFITIVSYKKNTTIIRVEYGMLYVFSFNKFCQVMMGEWVRIDFKLDHLTSGYTRDDLKHKAFS
jgi:hypothetical protein